MTHKVIVLLADGFEETEALAPVDIMRRCGYEVRLLSISQTTTVKSSHGIIITADGLLSDGAGEYELIMLPGGMPGTTNLNNSKAVRAEITKAHDAGKWLAAICAAPMVYGQLGLLKGRRATCYSGFEQYLTGALYEDTPVVVDGKIITAFGAGASLNLGKEIVAQLDGQAAADDVAAKVKMIS